MGLYAHRERGPPAPIAPLACPHIGRRRQPGGERPCNPAAGLCRALQGRSGTFRRQVVPRARRAGGSNCRLSVRLAILRRALKQNRGVPAPPISPVDSENPVLWVCLDVVSHSDQKSCTLFAFECVARSWMGDRMGAVSRCRVACPVLAVSAAT